MDHPIGFSTNEVFYRRFEDDALPLSEADIPLRPENRRKTDRAFLFVFIACIAILIPFVIYTLIHADINKLKGLRESDVSPYADEFYAQINESDIEKIAWRITLASFISLGLTLIMAALFRYATSFVVWGILIVSWAYFFVGTVLLWTSNIESFAPKIVFTIITLALLFILIFMKDKIRLVTMLFREGTKATFDMQMVFSVPAVAIFLLLVVAVIWTTITIYMSTAGTESGDSGNISSDFVTVVLVFTSIVAFWVIQFISGVQYTIVSGAITKWYFTRNKDFLGDPVYTSLYNAIKYHMGTVALGSLIITIVATLRALIRVLLNNSRCRVFADCFMRYIDRFVRFFTKNAYIVTAMHGTPFIQSGKQAVKLLTLNICNTISINSIGDFVLGMSYVLVTALSALITYFLLADMKYDYRVLAILFVIGISLICCCTILGTFETAFSTLFLCVCQDFLINNGADKPYAMTRNLMEFLDESKKTFSKKIQEKGLPTI